MELIRNKAYKADTPENTILRISTILNRKLGIILKESSYERDGLFSSRLSIANNHLMSYDIGTEGKGMGFDYALASAYGEFIERVQNQRLLFNREYQNVSNWSETGGSVFYNKLKDKDLFLKYKYAPDEDKTIFFKEQDLIRKYINPHNIEEIEEYYDKRTLTLLPFYSVFEEKVVDIPFEILEFSSIPNGVCAGNTPLEALLHGFSEILERYVVKKIYLNNIIFPTIPLSFFSKTRIYDVVRAIENKYDWKIEIKDCSCGLGLPVIGILIIDMKNHMYKFHLGADPSPITALERTLTELYQNRGKILLLPIDLDIQHKLLYDYEVKEIEFFKSHNLNMGYHHINIFSKDPDYNFIDFNLEWGKSDEKDIKLMIGLFRKLNTNIYIRDVSFLGFPSYFIYIPEVSETKNIFSNNIFNNFAKDYERLQRTYRNLYSSNTDDIEFAIEYLTSKKYIPFRPFYNSRDFWTFYDKDLLLSLLYNLINKRNRALLYIDKYLKKINKGSKEYLFFSCYKDTLIYNGDDKNDILTLIYSKDIINNVLEFSKGKNFLKFMHSSACFDCEKCKIKDTCSLIDSFKINKKIEIEYEKNIPNQKELYSLFNNTSEYNHE